MPVRALTPAAAGGLPRHTRSATETGKWPSGPGFGGTKDALAFLDRHGLVRRNARQRFNFAVRPGDLDARDLRRTAQAERQRHLALRAVARSRLHRAPEARAVV